MRTRDPDYHFRSGFYRLDRHCSAVRPGDRFHNRQPEAVALRRSSGLRPGEPLEGLIGEAGRETVSFIGYRENDCSVFILPGKNDFTCAVPQGVFHQVSECQFDP